MEKKYRQKPGMDIKLRNLRIANVAYAYNTPDGETLILIFNQSIYGGKLMEDELVNPIQCLQNDVKIDSRPRIFYPEEDNAQTIQFKGQCIKIVYDGPLPHIDVRRPTSAEWMNCSHFDMTLSEEWKPYSKSSCISTMNNTSDKAEENHIGGICSISTSLMPDYLELFNLRKINSFYTNDTQIYNTDQPML